MPYVRSRGRGLGVAAASIGGPPQVNYVPAIFPRSTLVTGRAPGTISTLRVVPQQPLAPIATPASTPASSAAATPALVPAPPSISSPATAAAPSTAAASTITATTPSGASVAVAAPPPGSYPTNQTYTDAAGNVWTWDPTNGWQITSPAASNVTTSVGLANFVSGAGTWLQSETLLSFLPNWATLGGGAVALYLAMSMLGKKGRR